MSYLFCLFILFMGFSQQEYWSGLPFPSPGDHISSELFTITHLSWVALHSIAHRFIESHKLLHHDKSVIREGGYDDRGTKFHISPPWRMWLVSKAGPTSTNYHSAAWDGT